ncbi:hypothetical protein BV898_08787 [Hypsibius exemplaris]|uniref:Thyroglobulin type-1 domain-containing protein n=1 Tax=Hypsibius exemplaris TaxID=2072580 RepID=A0A1W0WPD7_HYPEX|nr:hypothetical protein BV898_08787 [Hypsibius exemplaris]
MVPGMQPGSGQLSLPARQQRENTSNIPKPLFCDCVSNARAKILDSVNASDLQWILTCHMLPAITTCFNASRKASVVISEWAISGLELSLILPTSGNISVPTNVGFHSSWLLREYPNPVEHTRPFSRDPSTAFPTHGDPREKHMDPNCAQDGSYARYQVRESGQKDAFCVAPQNGEIVFDPFPAARVAGNVSALPDPLYCDCLSKSREIILDSSTAADMQWILTCDLRTGFHNPLQRQPDGLVCFDQMGSRSNKEPPLCTKEGKTKLATTASSATFGHAH